MDSAIQCITKYILLAQVNTSELHHCAVMGYTGWTTSGKELSFFQEVSVAYCYI